MACPTLCPLEAAATGVRPAQGGSAVEIGFNKSTSKGVNLYCQCDSHTTPVFLARDTNSPYVDNRMGQFKARHCPSHLA